MNQEQGFTLVEILIASTLSIVLLTALIQAFLTIKHTIKTQTAYDEVQENGRFAVFFLNRVVHNAGFNACDTTNHFRLEGFSAKQVSTSWPIKPKYDTDVLIAGQCQEIDHSEQFVKTAYYIAKTSYRSHVGSHAGSHGKSYALFAKRKNKQRQELVANVNSMTILYGIGDANDIEQYKHANQITDWQEVKSVDIALSLKDAKQKIIKEWHSYVALR